MKLLLDMNLSPGWVEILAHAGFTVIHWSDIGRHDATDTELMRFARENGFVVVTHDLDFSAILAVTGGEKPSVVQLRTETLRPEAIGPLLIGALNQLEAEISLGALVTLDAERARVRLLPLKVTGDTQ